MGRHEYEYGFGAARVLAGKLVRICVENFANSGMYLNNKGLHQQTLEMLVEDIVIIESCRFCSELADICSKVVDTIDL